LNEISEQQFAQCILFIPPYYRRGVTVTVIRQKTSPFLFFKYFSQKLAAFHNYSYEDICNHTDGCLGTLKARVKERACNGLDG